MVGRPGVPRRPLLWFSAKSRLDHLSPGQETPHNDDQGDDEQDVYETADLERNKAEQPENDEYDRERPPHLKPPSMLTVAAPIFVVRSGES